MENSELIIKALNYIKTETRKSGISIEEVANHAGFSADYFNRIFFAHTGFNVMEYVRFARLKKASLLLRTTSRDILDIAFECGYEAHESFTRAFKKQYGKTPSEYRTFFANKPLKHAETVDKTLTTRFLHEFPSFKPINADERIDSLLEEDAKKHGISAIVLYDNNGTQFFADEETSGTYVGLDEFQTGVYSADIISDSIEEIIRIYEKIGGFVSEFSFYSTLSEKELCDRFALANAEYKSIKQSVTQYLYTGSEKERSDCELEIKALSIHDLPKIKSWASQYGYDWKLEETLTQRDIYQNALSDLPFGVFKGNEMVGVCRTAIYELRGFRIGEIEGLCILEDCKKEHLCKEVYSSVINELLARKYLPFVCRTVGVEQDLSNIDPVPYGFEPMKTIFSVY